jgi:hypothetical protein
VDPWLPFFHLFPIIGAAATWFGLKHFRNCRDRLRTWARVDGIIVNRQRQEGEGTTWAPVYEYEYAGTKHVGTGKVSVGDREFYRVGATLTILVDPHHPTSSEVLDKYFTHMQYAPLVLGLAFLLGGGFFSVAMIAGWVK